MASADPRDPIYGRPYTGTPVLQNTSRTGTRTVLDMYAMKSVSASIADSDSHYIPQGQPNAGDLYHE